MVYLLVQQNQEQMAQLPFGKKYESIQFQIALRLWNIRGVEGEIYHMENGITRQYSKDGVIADLMCKVLPRAIVGD